MTVMSTDVIVLGLGTSGEDLALRLCRTGLEVVGIEPNLLGGECPFWACVPTKMMTRAATLVAEARRLPGVAGQSDVTPDWADVAARVRTEATGGWDDSAGVARFEEAGGTFVRGYGRLIGSDRVQVGEQIFEARRGIVIATGSQPIIPPIPGLDGVDVWDTHAAIAAESVPASLLVLGGGVVGCELAQVFGRFGADVTIVEGGERLLGSEEPEVSALIADVFAAEGISVVTGSPVAAVAADGAQTTVSLEDGRTIRAEQLLVAVGRRVDLSGLGLESAGVATDGPFVAVDDRLRAAEKIWAMGDITGKGMLTSVAMYQGGIIGDQLTGVGSSPATYHALPRATFTDPEIGSVGMTEAAALEAGLDVEVAVKQLGGTFRGWLHGPGNTGVVKLVIDRSTHTLVGGTAVGPSGGEVLGLLTLAVHAHTSVHDLARMIYGFPTFAGVIGEMVGAYARGTGKVLDPSFEPLHVDPVRR